VVGDDDVAYPQMLAAAYNAAHCVGTAEDKAQRRQAVAWLLSSTSLGRSATESQAGPRHCREWGR
jgi:hypothetical protein